MNVRQTLTNFFSGFFQNAAILTFSIFFDLSLGLGSLRYRRQRGMVYVSAPVEPPLPSDLELYSRVAQATQDEIHAEAGPTALFRSSQRGCFQNGVAVCGSSKIYSSRAFQRALLWAKK